MSNEKTKNYMTPFGEYAFLLETDDYPKTEASIWELKGRIETDAMYRAYREAVVKVPIFSSVLREKREGLFYRPYWLLDPQIENRLVIEDCRPLAGNSYDLEDFTHTYFAPLIRRRLDLRHEFPFHIRMVRVEDETWVMAVIFHHSILDPSKAFTVLTYMLARYHELVKGQWPTWVEAESTGDVIRKRTGSLVKPLPFLDFAKEQLSDLWIKNRKGAINPIASREIRDLSETQGRFSFLKIIEDEKLIHALVDRAVNAGCTLNDLNFAVARKTFSDWNKEHGKPAKKFRFMLATSLLGRMELPKEAGAGLGGLNVVSEGHEHADIDTLMHFYKEQRVSQLSRGVDVRVYMTMQKILGALRVFPMGVRMRLARPLVESIPVTFTISNIGSVWPKKIYPDGRQSLESRVVEVGDFRVEKLHSSISMSRNVECLTTVRTHNRRTFLNYVFDRFRFHKDEAQELSNRLFENLINAV